LLVLGDEDVIDRARQQPNQVVIAKTPTTKDGRRRSSRPCKSRTLTANGCGTIGFA
jgi:hypothetical protein